MSGDRMVDEEYNAMCEKLYKVGWNTGQSCAGQFLHHRTLLALGIGPNGMATARAVEFVDM
jgi:hypothetical protein